MRNEAELAVARNRDRVAESVRREVRRTVAVAYRAVGVRRIVAAAYRAVGVRRIVPVVGARRIVAAGVLHMVTAGVPSEVAAPLAAAAVAVVPLVTAVAVVVAAVGYRLLLRFRNYRRSLPLQPDCRNLNKMPLTKPLPLT